MLTLTDKVPYVFCQSRERIADVLTMCAIARGETLEEFGARPGVFSIINTNTPLTYDVPMTVGVMDMARGNAETGEIRGELRAALKNGENRCGGGYTGRLQGSS